MIRWTLKLQPSAEMDSQLHFTSQDAVEQQIGMSLFVAQGDIEATT